MPKKKKSASENRVLFQVGDLVTHNPVVAEHWALVSGKQVKVIKRLKQSSRTKRKRR